MIDRLAWPVPAASWLCAIVATAAIEVTAAEPAPATRPDAAAPLAIGMIGLDTSHCLEFTKLLNADPPDPELAGCRVVAVHPKGSPDIEGSVSRVPDYTVKIKAMGVEVIDDLPAMLARVDAVLLETNDGRPHLAQATAVIEAGKPLFIDKPVAGSLADAIAIYRLAKERGVPVFSSSSLRFGKAAQAVRGGSIGEVTGCDAWSPCKLEPTHPDLFWYGIHGCELLFTVMGTGVKTVTRTKTADFEFVTGVWGDGRIGTFRGIRRGAGSYGGTAFGMKGTASLGDFEGYRPLVVEIVKFFRTGRPPVEPEETLDLYAFMEAADESLRQGGVPVDVAAVRARAAGRRPLVIVITGESNSGGTAKNADATSLELAPRPSVQILNPDADKLRFEELHLGVNNLLDHFGLVKQSAICHGLENGLAGAVEGGKFPGRDRVWLIKTGHGGSRIAQWAPDDSSGYWAKFLKRVDAAKRQLPRDPQWVVWMSLGINDAIAGTPADSWRDDVIRHIERMRKELPGAIVVITQFQSMNRYPATDRAIAEIAARVPGVRVVDTTGATLADANHWDYAGYKAVAERMVEQTVAAIDPEPARR